MRKLFGAGIAVGALFTLTLCAVVLYFVATHVPAALVLWAPMMALVAYGVWIAVPILWGEMVREGIEP